MKHFQYSILVLVFIINSYSLTNSQNTTETSILSITSSSSIDSFISSSSSIIDENNTISSSFDSPFITSSSSINITDSSSSDYNNSTNNNLIINTSSSDYFITSSFNITFNNNTNITSNPVNDTNPTITLSDADRSLLNAIYERVSEEWKLRPVSVLLLCLLIVTFFAFLITLIYCARYRRYALYKQMKE